MSFQRLIRNAQWSITICLAFSTHLTIADQFVELTAEFEGTFWPLHGPESRRLYTTKCIVGHKSWMLQGDFGRNCTTTYWYNGTNLIEHTLITKNLQPPDHVAVVRMPVT